MFNVLIIQIRILLLFRNMDNPIALIFCACHKSRTIVAYAKCLFQWIIIFLSHSNCCFHYVCSLISCSISEMGFWVSFYQQAMSSFSKFYQIICCSCMMNCALTWAHFLSLAWSKLRLCSANHRAGYFSNLACDWLNIVWAYSKKDIENGPRSQFCTWYDSTIVVTCGNFLPPWITKVKIKMKKN